MIIFVLLLLIDHQVDMMDGFIEACKAVDKKKNGKKGGRLVRKKALS